MAFRYSSPNLLQDVLSDAAGWPSAQLHSSRVPGSILSSGYRLCGLLVGFLQVLLFPPTHPPKHIQVGWQHSNAFPLGVNKCVNLIDGILFRTYSCLMTRIKHLLGINEWMNFVQLHIPKDRNSINKTKWPTLKLYTTRPHWDFVVFQTWNA